MATASADPAKLEKAAAAVPAEVKDALEQAVVHGNLASEIARFTSAPQNPLRLSISAEGLVGALATARSTGNELDARLVQIAAEFRRAGGERAGVPWGWQGPVAPGAPASGPGDPAGTVYVDDAALQAALAKWAHPGPMVGAGALSGPSTIRRRADGRTEIRGPDGAWYIVSATPPPGTTPLGRYQTTVDFTNPSAGVGIAAAGTYAGIGGSTNPRGAYAPPEAYGYVRFDENGMPVVGPGGGAGQLPLRAPGVGGLVKPGDVQGTKAPGRYTGEPGSTAPPPAAGGEPPALEGPLGTRRGRIASGGALINVFAEMAKAANIRNKNIVHTQTSYYVDPRTGQRVAVVNAARITYEKPYDRDPSAADDDRQYVVIRWGQLTTEADLGRPVVVARPGDPGVHGLDGRYPSEASTYRIPMTVAR
jgi:hypothetical protein